MDPKLLERLNLMANSKDKEMHSLAHEIFYSNNPTYEEYLIYRKDCGFTPFNEYDFNLHKNRLTSEKEDE